MCTRDERRTGCLVGQEDETDDCESDLEIFSSGLDALFDHHMPASGTPGTWCSFTHHQLPLSPVVPDDVLGPSSVRGQDETRHIRYLLPPNTPGETGLMAHYQWDAGVLLSRILIESSLPLDSRPAASVKRYNHDDPRAPLQPLPLLRGANLSRLAVDKGKKAILEVGAGAGLPSLVAGRLAATLRHRSTSDDEASAPSRFASDDFQVVMTDYPSVPVLSALRASAQREGTGVQVQGLEWGREEAMRLLLKETSGQGFDVILAADTLWLTDQHQALLTTFETLLRCNKDAIVLLAFGFHTGPFAGLKFLQMAEASGLVVCAMEHEVDKGALTNTAIQRGAAGARWLVRQPRPGDEEDESGTMLYHIKEWTGAEQETETVEERGRWSAIVCLRWSQAMLNMS